MRMGVTSRESLSSMDTEKKFLLLNVIRSFTAQYVLFIAVVKRILITLDVRSPLNSKRI